MNISIKQAKKTDWKTIQKLNLEVCHNSSQFDPHLNLDDPKSKKSKKHFKEVCSDSKKWCCVIAFDKSKNIAVGYLAGSESNYDYRTNKRGEIHHMGVNPLYRSKGIGSNLVDKFKNWCKNKNITHVAACTYAKDPKALNFYQKQGLLPIDITLEGKIS